MIASNNAVSHRIYGVHGSRLLPGGEISPAFVATAVMVSVDVALAAAVPAAIVAGFGVQVAPVSEDGTAQAIVTAAASDAPAGVIGTFTVIVAGVPAVTGSGLPDVPLDPESARLKPTTGIVLLVDVPPPFPLVGFAGFVIVTVTFPPVDTSLAGTLTISVVPSVLAVPVSDAVPNVTLVELLKPTPVIVRVCADVAPATSPVLGENDVNVGVTLSMFVAASVADLSVVFESFGSLTVAEFVTLGNALGPTETVSVTVLFPPAAASAVPVYVHVRRHRVGSAHSVIRCKRRRAEFTSKSRSTRIGQINEGEKASRPDSTNRAARDQRISHLPLIFPRLGQDCGLIEGCHPAIVHHNVSGNHHGFYVGRF